MVFEFGDADRLAALSALGLGPAAKARDIISAYRRLARRNHPDLAPGQPGRGQRFAEISDAYRFLTRATTARSAVTSPTNDLDPEGKRGPQRPDPSREQPPQELYPSPAPVGDHPMFVAGPVIIRPLPSEQR